MNEDERWALEYFKSVKVGDNFDIQKELKCREIISGLLLNQQKEIEDLKTITRGYEAYKLGDGDEIMIASKKWFNNGYFKENFVSKDKIKEKIKELEKEYKKYDKEELINLMKITSGKISVLEELLGK